MSEQRVGVRSYVRPHVVDSQTVAFLSEATIEAIHGRIYPPLVRQLSGNMTAPEIIAQLADTLDVLQVIHGLETLRRRNWITDASGDEAHPLEALRESLNARPEEAMERLGSIGVAVRTVGAAGGEGLEALLRLQGVRVVAEPQAGLLIVVADDVNHPELDGINRSALTSARPWMLARPFGSVAWIGPVFEPGRSACWACLTSRLAEVRAAWGIPESAPLPLSELSLAPMQHAAWSLAALEAAKWILQPSRDSRLLTFDLKSFSVQTHAVPRRESCSACGKPPVRRQAAPLVLASRSKAFIFDGGYRASTPEETYARCEHLVGPLTGIVHSVERAAPTRTGGLLNVYVARHNFRMTRTATRPAMSFGKGVTDAQARAGALCEALECYSGVSRGDEPLIRASLHDLGESAIHPNACLGFSERQYAEREEWNRDAPPLLWTPERFNESEPTDWTAAWSLTRGEPRYVAAAYCYYDHPVDTRFCWPDSNGNAAGASPEDAILQGLLELIERDAIAIWWYNRARRPAVDISTGYDEALRRHYRALGRRLCVLDLTTDLGIPVFAAISMGTEPDDVMTGYGAHLDPFIAFHRALSEINQDLAVSLEYGHGGTFSGQLTDRSFLEPDRSLPPRTIADYARPGREDLRDDVLDCVELLRQKNLEVMVVDQTREEIGLPVFKVIVPGLRHFWRRFAPGRLYDVPASLGWLERPLREDELNPADLTV